MAWVGSSPLSPLATPAGPACWRTPAISRPSVPPPSGAIVVTHRNQPLSKHGRAERTGRRADKRFDSSRAGAIALHKHQPGVVATDG